jgi:nucleoside-diphosphate-sugar epimerase/uncharacterized membrane protein
MNRASKPTVVVTGAAGDIGSALARTLESDYAVVGLDRPGSSAPCELIEFDLTSDESVDRALQAFRERHGTRIAAVVHLAAYFDFTGKDNRLYREVNVDGTARLLRALQSFEVGQFVYSSTMLVHEAVRPGERINEDSPIEPSWAYPRSKAEAEQAIRDHHGRIPYVILRLAGLYDERTCVPTLAHQIARIYERDLQSRLYPGPTDAGQAFIHRADMMRALRATIDRRDQLPSATAILVGEPDPMTFDELQDTIGRLIHGEEEWKTLTIPPAIAKAGAWIQEKAEPVIPDAIDRGQPPFVRPFMIDIAQDHYALDISRARELLGWTPQHDLRRSLPDLVAALKADPADWYKANRVTPPWWLQSASAAGEPAEQIRRQHEIAYRESHRRHLWAPLANVAMATWLMTAPPLTGYVSAELRASDMAAGIALLVLSSLSLYWRAGWARWSCALVGCWLLFAPLLFWTPSAAEYLNDTLVGMLVIGFAVLTPPTPGVSPIATQAGPTVPPGWDYSPSAWLQRLPVIALAFVGLYISRYLAAYQLGHIDAVWEPFFPGGPNPKNGTEEIITSSVSEAWPVSDAGLGAVTYALEILTGIIGSAKRWRTMPWLVVLFGLMIVPLGLVSLIFIIIQPIIIGTWCSLCLIAAAAMLLQIPYSLDELVATGQFLRRRKRAGQSLVHVFLMGDTDESARAPDQRPAAEEFARPLSELVRDAWSGGVSLPGNLVASIAIGAWLMLTRLTVGTEGSMANADHLIGSLVITTSVIALAEVARPFRFLNVALGAALLFTPFWFDAEGPAAISSILCGLALVALSLRRGAVRSHYGRWTQAIV